MKKQYTKKQILEAIRRWESELRLRKLNEEQNPWEGVDVARIVKKAQANDWTAIRGRTLADVKTVFHIPNLTPRNNADRRTAENQGYFLVLWNDGEITAAYMDTDGSIAGCGCGAQTKGGFAEFAKQYRLDLDNAVAIYSDGELKKDVKPVRITPVTRTITTVKIS